MDSENMRTVLAFSEAPFDSAHDARSKTSVYIYILAFLFCFSRSRGTKEKKIKTYEHRERRRRAMRRTRNRTQQWSRWLPDGGDSGLWTLEKLNKDQVMRGSTPVLVLW
jgi:hypothetical protein